MDYREIYGCSGCTVVDLFLDVSERILERSLSLDYGIGNTLPFPIIYIPDKTTLTKPRSRSRIPLFWMDLASPLLEIFFLFFSKP